MAVANAVAIGYPAAYPAAYPAVGVAKVAAPVIAKAVDDYDPNPQYSFSYHIAVRITMLTRGNDDIDL